jgi:endoglucanase
MHKNTKRIVAGLLAVATIAPAAANLTSIVASAGQICGESTFDYKALPWHTCESSPAKQNFGIEDGAFHVEVLVPEGGEKSKWDLQVRHRKLDFYAGQTYEVSFDVKSNRDGMELCSKIGETGGDYEEYFELDGKTNDMHMGPAMGGQWGSAVKLTTEYQTFKGTFKPTKDLKSVEWTFHYAKDSNGYGGNAQKGDEIWFDNMSIVCTTTDEYDPDPNASYGATDRHYSGLKNNFISVNQLGYYPELAKIATLGDNDGDILHGAEKIKLSSDTYTYELVDASSGSVVHTGTTGKKFYDEDSHDNVCKIDFSDFKTPGTYYLRIKGEEWRSFPFEISDKIYTDSKNDMLKNALNYFYQNRSGLDIEEKYITSGGEGKGQLAHKGGHKTDTATVQTEWHNEYLDKSEATGTYGSSKITASGGWYDAGDHGKYVVNGGISIWTLQNMYERALLRTENGEKKYADGSGTINIPESGNGVPDVLDECAYELDWMTKMVVDSSEPTWGKYAGLVYHKLHDHKWTGLATKPWDYEEEWGTVRIVKPPTLAATLNYAACAAQAARLWKPYDATKSAKYLDEAKKAYQAYKKHWYEASASEETNKTSLYAPMNQAKGGGPYGDNEVRDDGYWAACELYVSAKELGDSDADTYLSEMKEYKNAFKVTTRITGGENASGEGSFTTFNWGNTASAGSLTLALHEDLLADSEKKTVEDSILAAAKEYMDEEEKQGYGIPYKYDGPGYTDENNLDKSIVIKGYEWGSNSMVINNLIVMAYAYDLTGKNEYMNGVVTGMDYLLGCNPLAFSYVTGYGEYCEKNPHHRYWSHELDDKLPLAPDGVLSGGPNAGLQDPYVRALGFVPGAPDNPSQRCFVDSIEAWSTNEVTINWNAPLAWIVEFFQSKDEIKTIDPKITTEPGTTTTEPGTTTTTSTSKSGGDDPKADVWGDTNCNGTVDVSDAVLLAKYLNSDASGNVTEQGKVNANVISGKLDADDLSAILMLIAKIIKSDQCPLSALPKA